ncbi:MAG: hypothetical protein IKE70_04380 [Bacilli bacterium]|nr:hypothetical protein [Bacilli bacterium]
MFYNYEILNVGGEDVLYLYLSMKYEFSKELMNHDLADLGRRCSNFIQMNHIPFRGNKVYLVVDGVVVKSIRIDDSFITKYTSNHYSPDSFMVTLDLKNQSKCEISLREYLLSVLFSFYDYSLSIEVLKAICILFNGYAFKMMRDFHEIEEENDFLNYQSLFYYQDQYDNFLEIKNSFNSIIDSTDGMFLQYEGDYILPFIHYSNGGKTNMNEKYPYLSSIKSLWDILSPYYVKYIDYSYEDLNRILRVNINSKSRIEVRINSKIKKIIFGGSIFTSLELRKLLHLNSNDFYLIIYKDFLRIIMIGKGNSLGLSLFGANEIASNGGTCFQILSYYFPNTKICRNIKELS